ncbi:MAG: 50S ribosome-binding GTPase, partial [Myxococcota bacterium]|nr:50S ribosome-binding GTPase [Myxococcota bacterium]
GKSSLFNRLVKERRALVSATPGTTRDVVERAVLLKGRSITFFDTAGERSTPGPVEVDGLELAHSLLGEMDLVLVVVPLHRVPDELELAALDRSEGLARLRVGTHLDLLDSEPSAGRVDVAVSNATGEGLADLQEAILLALVETPDPHMTMVATSQRQHELFGCMAGHLGQASEALTGHLGPAVAAEEVTRALLRLDELTGVDAREGVLDRLFSRFCIGK